MSKNTLNTSNNQVTEVVEDGLSSFLRSAAQRMLQVAVEEEVNAFISNHEQERLVSGQQRIVRNGYLPTRAIKTGIGDVSVSVPRTRDRAAPQNKAVNYQSSLVPKYMRRTVTLDVLLPLLYLKGISTGDFSDALAPLLGESSSSITPSLISRLKSSWYEDYEAWQSRDLSDKHYVYWWVDGIYLTARMESEKTCMLVIIGADANGNKELVGLNDGFRESKASWQALLCGLQQRGLPKAARVAVGDGALGFWGALNECYPTTRQQRCWVHKTANVMDKLPRSQREMAKSRLHDIYFAQTKREALAAWTLFSNTYAVKYPKAVRCLEKDKETLLTFYDFPAEHWIHLRTTNPIESTFATVRHRTKKSKNCFSRKTIIASVFKLCCEAQKRWKKLNGTHHIEQVLQRVIFVDGIIAEDSSNHINIEEKIAA